MFAWVCSIMLAWGCGSENPTTSLSISPPQGRIVVQETNLDFGYTAVELTIEISNDGQGPLTWSSVPGQPWVSVIPSGGMLPPASTVLPRVTVVREGLTPGVHSATLQIQSNGGNGSIPILAGKLAPPAQAGLEVNVRDFGALGDGLHDDTPAFNAALTALASGGVLYVPQGTYILVPRSGTPDRALDLVDTHDLRIRGDGAEESFIQLAPGTYSGDTHLVFLRRARYVTFEDITLDGNKSAASFSDEQSHCVEVWSSVEISFERTRFQNCRGDGIRFLGVPSAGEPWTETVAVLESAFMDNGRSGVAVQRAVRGLRIQRSTFDRISDQSIDIEPTGGSAPTDILIEQNTIRHTTATWAIGIGGIGGTDVARRLTFRENQILQGGVLVYKVDELTFENNTIVSDALHVPLRITHSVTNSRIVGNDIRGPAGGTEGVLQIVALNGAYPENLIVQGNTVRAPQGSSGVYVRDALGGIEIRENRILGIDGANGVHIATIVGVSSERDGFHITDNVIENFRIGVQLSTRNDPFASVDISRNSISTSGVSAPGVIGILFEQTGDYAAFATVEGNLFGGGVDLPILVR